MPVQHSYHEMFLLSVCPSFLEWGYVACIIFHGRLEEYVLTLAALHSTTVVFHWAKC